MMLEAAWDEPVVSQPVHLLIRFDKAAALASDLVRGRFDLVSDRVAMHEIEVMNAAGMNITMSARVTSVSRRLRLARSRGRRWRPWYNVVGLKTRGKADSIQNRYFRLKCNKIDIDHTAYSRLRPFPLRAFSSTLNVDNGVLSLLKDSPIPRLASPWVPFTDFHA